MKNFKNVILIYPEDPSIDFLLPLFDGLKELFPNIIVHRPKYGATLHTIIDDDTQLVLFIGHGTPSGLFGGVDENKEKKMLCDIPSGARLLQDCSIVLFSCNSSDYIIKLQRNSAQIKNYIVFGDMPTDWSHINHNRDIEADYWSDCNEEHLSFYKSSLVESVLYGFKKAININSFHSFVKGINHIINVKINEIIQRDNWSKNQKLQLIERLIELKNEIRYNEIIV